MIKININWGQSPKAISFGAVVIPKQ